MKKKSYCPPLADWGAVAIQELLCDSYGSGIDDFGYEDIDWTVTT